jgi:hypothetical protein
MRRSREIWFLDHMPKVFWRKFVSVHPKYSQSMELIVCRGNLKVSGSLNLNGRLHVKGDLDVSGSLNMGPYGNLIVDEHKIVRRGVNGM